MTAIQFLSLGRRLANLYAALCAPICRQYGINQTGFDILLFCANNPKHNTARDLGTVRGIKRGIASIGVETLIQSGFLERQDDPQDRRIRRLIPTEKAAPVIANGQRMQEHFAAMLTADITQEEYAALRSITRKLENCLSSVSVSEGDDLPC